MLQALARRKGVSLSLAAEDMAWDREYDKLADWVRGSLNMGLVYRMVGIDRPQDCIVADYPKQPYQGETDFDA